MQYATPAGPALVEGRYCEGFMLASEDRGGMPDLQREIYCPAEADGYFWRRPFSCRDSVGGDRLHMAWQICRPPINIGAIAAGSNTVNTNFRGTSFSHFAALRTGSSRHQ